MAEYMYGVREDGTVISINDLDDIEKGLRCKCKCPQCRRDLQACSLLESNKKSRYFRHHNEGYNREGIDSLNGCTATTANESGLHMMAKELIAEIRKIAFPAMNLPVELLNLQYSNDVMAQLPKRVTLRSDFVFEGNEVVEIESRYPQFRPDVKVSSDRETFLIEIAVTHRVDAAKREKVQSAGLAMLEIDLREYVETGIRRDALRKVISEEIKHKQWISYTKELVDQARQDLIAQAENIKNKLEEEEKQRRQDEKLRLRYFTPDIYTSILKVNRNDYAFEQYARRNFHFETTRNNYPFYIDIPISGEIVFTCDRRIWQGQIFDRWVYNRSSDNINLFDIWTQLTQTHGIQFNNMLVKKFCYPGVDDPTFLPYKVIHEYFCHLERLDFVRIEGKWAKVLSKHNLQPPDQKNAFFLHSALSKVDANSPQSSSLIKQKLYELEDAEHERNLQIERAKAEEKAAEALAESKLAKQLAQRNEDQRMQDFYLKNLCPQCGKLLKKMPGKAGTNWLCVGGCGFYAFENSSTGELIMKEQKN